MLTRSDAVHLLRRTEFVARPDRVAALEPLTRAQAVDNVLAVPANPGSVGFTATKNWERGQELVHYWLDRMAHDSPRPIQEKLALFWHGHFVSSLDKVSDAEVMRQQIDLFRHAGLGNLRDLAIRMSTQVAMLRYLDNNQNKRSSPNQNFGRELLELFMLGVGNYTEADVEACTAAWTGHTDRSDTDEYRWRDDWHDSTRRPFLGSTTCPSADPREHGGDTIRTMLGDGRATAGPNAGRPTREVAAEFLSRKLWAFFAGTSIPDPVLDHLRGVALAHDFAIRPWLHALLMRDEFYSTEVRQGLLRSPVDYVVAMLAATGRRSSSTTPTWLMEGMGQALLYPPNVSGWKHNGYYVSASAFGDRVRAARQVTWRVLDSYWGDSGDETIHLPGGSVTRTEINAVHAMESGSRPPAIAERRAIADRLAAGMRAELTDSTRAAIYQYADTCPVWALVYVVGMLLMSPEMNVA